MDGTEHAAEVTPAPAILPPSPTEQVNAALAALNHPSNLAVPDRLHALEVCVRVMAAQLIPLLPTE